MERKACILKAHPLTLSVPSRGSQCRAKSDSPSLPPAGLALFFWNEPVYVHRRQEEGPRHMQDINSVKPDERLALDLMAAIRADAEAACAPSPVEMVSVTIDVRGRAGRRDGHRAPDRPSDADHPVHRRHGSSGRYTDHEGDGCVPDPAGSLIGPCRMPGTAYPCLRTAA